MHLETDKVLPDELWLVRTQYPMTEYRANNDESDAIRLWVIAEHDNKYQAYRAAIPTMRISYLVPSRMSW